MAIGARASIRTLAALAATCLVPSTIRAQKTGVLNPDSNRVSPDSRDYRALQAQGSPAVLSREEKDRFARLLLNLPDLGGSGSSAWRFTIRSSGENASEAGIHVNLTDIVPSPIPKKSDTLSAFMLGLAGPLNKKPDSASALADLNGLSGTTRGELLYIFHLATIRFWIPSVSAHVDGAAPTFIFAQTSTLARDTVRRPAFRAGSGVLFKSERALLRFGYDYENAYKASRDQSICTPLIGGPAGTLTCESLALGAPKHYRRHFGAIEVRYSFRKYVAFRAQFTRDFKNVNGYDLPIWFIPDASAKLGGGIRFGYRTDQKHLTASIFTSVFQV